jgi:hypothetical protein
MPNIGRLHAGDTTIFVVVSHADKDNLHVERDFLRAKLHRSRENGKKEGRNLRTIFLKVTIESLQFAILACRR